MTSRASEDEPSRPTYSKVAASGAKVILVGQLLKMVGQTAGLIVLARLLTPTDYGLFAIVFAVVAFGEVFRDFGLSTAAIQAPSLTRAQQSNLFWINTSLGAVLGGGLLLAAPLVQHVTSDPRATDFARTMAILFVLNGALAQYRADLNRRLRFGALVSAEVAGVFVGTATAVVAALAGAGVWSLVLQQVSSLGIALLLSVSLAGWLPRPPDPEGDVRPFLRFGLGMVGTQTIGYLNSNIDTLTIGVRLSAAELGLYNRAHQLLMQTLNQIRNPTTTVALPVLSKLDPGGETAGRAIVRGQAALGYTLVAGTAFAAGAADPLILLALGPTWSAASPVFAVLAAAGAFQTIGYVGYWIFVARGLTGKLFMFSLMGTGLRVVLVLLGSTWGLVGVAVGYATAPALTLPLTYALLSRWTPLPARALQLGAVRILFAASAAFVATRLMADSIDSLPSVAEVAICALTTVTAYGLMGLVVPPVRRDLIGVLRFGRDAFSR